ncbi:hypothetical protein GGF41_006170 [Coemansia sp. RSA 2531]|nr:hypothetical protein GGF41_006170 [Coemansia sp. RSA 2531]
MANGSMPGKRALNDTGLRRGSDCTNRRVFSLPIVWMTSSGGVPSSSVMIENWCTWSLPGNSGVPSNISAKIQPALQISTATSYFCQVSIISGAR